MTSEDPLDAIAIPGLWPSAAVPKHPMDTAAWGLCSSTLEIGGTKAGKAVVKNSASDLRISHNDAGSVIIGVVRASLSARRIGA